MFGGAAQTQFFIVALDPEPFRAPGDGLQSPVVILHQRQEVGDADFQRVDAQAAAQRALAGGDKIFHRQLGGHDGAGGVKESGGRKTAVDLATGRTLRVQ